MGKEECAEKHLPAYENEAPPVQQAGGADAYCIEVKREMYIVSSDHSDN